MVCGVWCVVCGMWCDVWSVVCDELMANFVILQDLDLDVDWENFCYPRMNRDRPLCQAK